MSKSCQPLRGVWIIVADSLRHRLQPERGLICAQKKSWRDWISVGRHSSLAGEQCWCEHDVSLRGDQGLRMKGTAALSSVFGWLRAAVGAIVDMLICIRLARALGVQRRPRGVAPFKIEAKGRASRQPFYADTYPYIIGTTVHINR